MFVELNEGKFHHSRRGEGCERLLLNKMTDSWPSEETNSIQGQRRGWIAQSLCVIKFY